MFLGRDVPECHTAVELSESQQPPIFGVECHLRDRLTAKFGDLFWGADLPNLQGAVKPIDHALVCFSGAERHITVGRQPGNFSNRLKTSSQVVQRYFVPVRPGNERLVWQQGKMVDPVVSHIGEDMAPKSIWAVEVDEISMQAYLGKICRRNWAYYHHPVTAGALSIAAIIAVVAGHVVSDLAIRHIPGRKAAPTRPVYQLAPVLAEGHFHRAFKIRCG